MLGGVRVRGTQDGREGGQRRGVACFGGLVCWRPALRLSRLQRRGQEICVRIRAQTAVADIELPLLMMIGSRHKRWGVSAWRRIDFGVSGAWLSADLFGGSATPSTSSLLATGVAVPDQRGECALHDGIARVRMTPCMIWLDFVERRRRRQHSSVASVHKRCRLLISSCAYAVWARHEQLFGTMGGSAPPVYKTLLQSLFFLSTFAVTINLAVIQKVSPQPFTSHSIAPAFSCGWNPVPRCSRR